MSTTTRAGLAQPALIGGAVVGTLSALPIVAAGNFCCCLWVVTGGAVAAYVLQQNQSSSITLLDGALAGLAAGVVGAFVYLLLSIPITLMMAPVERAVIERLVDTGRLPPEFREFVGSYMSGALKLALGFCFMLAGSVIAAAGGALGAVIFKKPLPPGTIDVPASHNPQA